MPSATASLALRRVHLTLPATSWLSGIADVLCPESALRHRNPAVTVAERITGLATLALIQVARKPRRGDAGR